MNRIIIFVLLNIPLIAWAELPYSGEIKPTKGVVLKYVVDRFDKAKNTTTDCGGGYLCVVDNKPAWGADGNVPETILKELWVIINGEKTRLETTGMYNPGIAESKEHGSLKVEKYYDAVWKVRGRFSDGAGAYYAEWLVAKGTSTRVMLGDGELLYDAVSALGK